ncbi:EAL domain-containing protein [Photobacterium makurazakiensis]|uniref:EAL domain-containing protein n=1 Tax=Photobacterium makurazakiensis TaxID=2910234 RepID=UPI003D0C4A5C
MNNKSQQLIQLQQAMKENEYVHTGAYNTSLPESVTIDPNLQPIFDYNMRVVGAELLSRVVDGSDNNISEHFYNTGSCVSRLSATKASINYLTKHYSSLPNFIKGSPININIDADALGNTSWIEEIISCCKSQPFNIRIEITERYPILQTPSYLRNLKLIHQAGIALILDDFGSGHFNFDLLTLGLFTEVKFSNRFVRIAMKRDRQLRLLKELNYYFSLHGMQTTIEGIENITEFDRAVETGCNKLQGYFMCEPFKIYDTAQNMELEYDYI